MGLKEWLREIDSFDTEIYSVLSNEFGMNNMPKDLKKINTESKWDELKRRLTVERFKQVNHDQKARQRLSDKVNKLEKVWRKETGIIKTSIQDKRKNKSIKKKKQQTKTKTKKKSIHNTATKKKSKVKQKKTKKNIKPSNVKKHKKMDALRPWMQKQGCWVQELYIQLKKKGIKSPRDLKTLNEKKFDKIINKVRVDRFKELKDQNSKKRLENKLINFEKKWRKLSGNPKSNLRNYQ